MANNSTLRKAIITFAVACFFLSSAAVASIFVLTEGTIKATKVTKTNNAIATVVPAFDNDPVAEKFTKEVSGGVLTFAPARKQGKLVGMAVETFSDEGYSGRISIMVGFLPDGTINGITVLAQHETPGLGSKMAEQQAAGGKPVFSTQFMGKNPATFKLSVRKDGGDVDAITASTISSRAYCDAIQRAYVAFMSQDKK